MQINISGPEDITLIQWEEIKSKYKSILNIKWRQIKYRIK